MLRTGLNLYRSWFTLDWYQTKTIILWYDVNDLAKTAFLSLIQVIQVRQDQRRSFLKNQWYSRWTVHHLTTTKSVKMSRCLRFYDSHRKLTIYYMHVELTMSITFIWLLGCVKENSTARSFRGKYTLSKCKLSFQITWSINSIFYKCIAVFVIGD